MEEQRTVNANAQSLPLVSRQCICTFVSFCCRRCFFTPKALYPKAQGRAAHPGLASQSGRLRRRRYTSWSGAVSQSLVQVYLHIVFSTNARQPFLEDRELCSRTHGYLAGACKNQGAPSLKVGGVEDHVHILCRMARVISISYLIQEIKRESSKWIKNQDATLSKFHWQSGYGAFSVSPSHVPALIEYIENQEEHHRHESFKDEYRRLCKKYGVAIDERYVWE